MNPIQILREKTGATQATLAKIGNTSQPTIAAYESGTKSLTLRTLERLAGASGFELEINFIPPLTREERRSLALHWLIAKKLKSNPETVLKKAKSVLGKMLLKHPSASPLLKEWQSLLRLPTTELVESMTDAKTHARELRQVTPFAGILNAKERTRFYQTFSKGK